MIRTDLYRQKISDLKETLKDAGYSLDISSVREELSNLEAELAKEEVYTNLQKSTEYSKKAQHVRNKINAFDKAEKAISDAEEMVALAEEENDDTFLGEIDKELSTAEKDIEDMRLRALLKGKYDGCNAIMTLHAGAGGTEACDWTEMLYRMYICYSEKHGYKITELDRLDGDSAGLKSVSFKVEGDNAYGYLKAEKGVHRLVRISPFDANAKRHTSFSSVEVMPEIEDTGEIEIRPEDIKVDTYRSSGAGGQHVNKTSSAVRLIHKPTGIVVACQEERSQFQNREKCMLMLSSKLYQMEQERIESEYSGQRRSQVGMGMRNEKIRTYNFPQSRVTDHRIGLTLYKLDAVMNGDLDELIDALVSADQAEKLRESGEAQ